MKFKKLKVILKLINKMKQFKISFHESQTGRKVIDVTDDNHDEPASVVSGRHKRTSFDLSKSVLDSATEKEKPGRYVNIDENHSNQIRNLILNIQDYINTNEGYAEQKSDDENTQPLDPAPIMFKSDEDIYISDDGTMITRSIKDKPKYNTSKILDETEKTTFTPTPKSDKIHNSLFCG